VSAAYWADDGYGCGLGVYAVQGRHNKMARKYGEPSFEWTYIV